MQTIRRVQSHRRAKVAELITHIEKQEVIGESKSPRSSSNVLLKKKTENAFSC